MPVAPTIDRTTLVQGPGHIEFPTAQLLYCNNITAVVERSTFSRVVGGFGRIGAPNKVDEIIRVTCTPAGQLTALIAAFLWPYGSTAVNASIFGAADVAISVWSKAGVKLTLTAAAITRMPSITMGAAGIQMGQFEITGILGKSSARTAANGLYTIASSSFTGYPTASQFVMLPVSAAWNSGTPVAKNGWTVEFDLNLKREVYTDVGTFDFRFMSCEARARCRPIAYAETQWDNLKLQSTGAAIGGSRTVSDLVLTQDAGGLVVTLKNAELSEVPFQFSENDDRVGDCLWTATRDLASGYGALFSVVYAT